METLDDLKGLAVQLNPAVGYWDPLKLAEYEFWDNTNEETIGWLRHVGRCPPMPVLPYRLLRTVSLRHAARCAHASVQPSSCCRV